MSASTVVTQGVGSFGNVNFVVTDGFGDYGGAAPVVTGRSKDYSIGGIPIPFEDKDFDYATARALERRRQILHEDQIMIDVIVQAVTTGLIK